MDYFSPLCMPNHLRSPLSPRPVAIGAVGLVILSTLATVDSSIQRGWSPLEIAARLPVDNWNSYSAVLEESPLRTKAITSATVYAIGDGISQVSSGKSISTLDRGRMLRSTLAGLLGHGPLSHFWYNLSEGLFQAWGLEGWMWNGIGEF